MQKLSFSLIFALLELIGFSQPSNSTLPYPNSPAEIPGMKLVWADEFNFTSKPNPEFWKYEKGFVRNEELQCHQEIEK